MSFTEVNPLTSRSLVASDHYFSFFSMDILIQIICYIRHSAQPSDWLAHPSSESGETLSKIAPKYGIGWKTLATHNNIQSPYTIRIGQDLKLPEGATIPEGAATSTASEQGNKKTTTAYERIDSGMLGSEVYLVVETANVRGKKVDIEIFDQEKLLAEDDETAIKVIRDDQETDWINAVSELIVHFFSMSIVNIC
ncbi:MAG: LysM domain-containing protein [Bacteroidota bacterium]